MTIHRPSSPTAFAPFELPYAQRDRATLTLDVYAQGESQNAQVVLYLHGGGWCGGDKRDDAPLFERFVRAGMVCVCPQYRLAPVHRWPACLDDARAALRWVLAHVTEHGGDPDKITVMGYSAGGHLALQLAATQRDAMLIGMVGLAAPTDLVLDNFRRLGLSECTQKLFGTTQINADVLEQLWHASPINHLHPGLPRCLQIHGERDEAVPVSQAQHFHGRLRHLGVESTLISLPETKHRISEWPVDHPEVFDRLLAWLGWDPNASPRTSREVHSEQAT